jgi:hypothetical protein
MDKIEAEVLEAIEKEFNLGGVSMGSIEIIGIALKVFDSLLSKMPNYDERKKNLYYKLKKHYLEVLHAEERDMQELLNTRDELLLMLSTYADEIGGAK